MFIYVPTKVCTSTGGAMKLMFYVLADCDASWANRQMQSTWSDLDVLEKKHAGTSYLCEEGIVCAAFRANGTVN
jgi:hypothetical protein